MTSTSPTDHKVADPVAAGGGDLALLVVNLRRARQTILDESTALEIDRALAELDGAELHEPSVNRKVEVRLRELCFRHGLLRVLALSGMPLVYDLRGTYSDNLLGPWAAVPDEDPTTGVEPRTLLGVPIGYPIGVAASALTATARHIEFYARHGFNILTYKTVRSRLVRPHPYPNWVYLRGFSAPLDPQELAGVPEVVGDSETYLQDPAAYSMANSFGVPSPDPSVWQRDVHLALERLAELDARKLLIVSVMGTPADEGMSAQELADDFAVVASKAASAGAPAIELNLSCLNTVDYAGEGMQPPVAHSPELTLRVVETVRAKLDEFSQRTRIVVKLGPPPKDQISAFKRHLYDVIGPIAGMIDAISGVNTAPARVVNSVGDLTFRETADDPGRDRPEAGVSGIAIRTLGQTFVRHVVELRATETGWDHLEIIGMGGVMTPDDVRAYRELGADAVQTATAASHNPELPAQVVATGRAHVSEDDVFARITQALQDPRWRYRTIEGIAADTGLDAALVRGVLERHPDLVRETNLRDPQGRQVYVPSDRPRSGKELLADLRDVLVG